MKKHIHNWEKMNETTYEKEITPMNVFNSYKAMRTQVVLKCWDCGDVDSYEKPALSEVDK